MLLPTHCRAVSLLLLGVPGLDRATQPVSARSAGPPLSSSLTHPLTRRELSQPAPVCISAKRRKRGLAFAIPNQQCWKDYNPRWRVCVRVWCDRGLSRGTRRAEGGRRDLIIQDGLAAGGGDILAQRGGGGHPPAAPASPPGLPLAGQSITLQPWQMPSPWLGIDQWETTLGSWWDAHSYT